ncbi:MAG: hypothetical protein KGH89_00165 [Thaumarchaeota archaeon]|nr:hypothetical protein [Nitrososphaerota archaeon]MDE1868068.1 hypothetical protein [Nitrososphaerota archaeon]
MADYDLLTVVGQIGSIGTAIGTIALVFLFWKTIQQLEETVKLSKIQANYRFRPWVGPFNRIEFLSSTADGHDQFSITVKNYGEIPSSSVIAKYVMKNELPKREVSKSNDVTSFNLGPLLPNMEKRYWFFIDSDLIKKAKAGSAQIFTLLYFQYEHLGGNSGYGLISRYDSMTDSFVHVDMWID